MLQQALAVPPVRERFLADRLCVAYDVVDKPQARLQDDHRRDLSTHEYIVAYRKLLVDRQVDDALIDPFVAAAYEDDLRSAAVLFGCPLRERAAGWREKNDFRLR